jgi:outer membrane cobalamin receptor
VKPLLTILASILIVSTLHSQSTVSGFVTDEKSEEPMIGAAVQLIEAGAAVAAGLDGSFRFNGIKPGTYTLKVSFLGYEPHQQTVTVGNANVAVNIKLKDLSVLLEGASIVARRDESSEQTARLVEKNSMNVVNTISAKEIEVSPDITVANVVQRVSGVSLERNNNGDGQYAIVRGMDKRYNYTLVNGIKIPSPDPRNRYVPLDIFPSDLLERLEVSKALTPNMEGDAIGGVIDMKMKTAPERFTVNFSAGTGYNQLFIGQAFRAFDRSTTSRFSPRITNGEDYRAEVSDFPLENIDFRDVQAPLNQVYSLSIGNRYFDGKLGVLVAGSYQNTFRGANSLFMSTFINQEDNTPYYEIVQDRLFSVEQRRGGAHARVDYEFNDRNRINLYLGAIALNEFETRTRVDTILKIGRGQGPGTGRIELRERSRQRFQNIYNGTLQGEHELSDKLRADWSAVYSLASNDDPDMAQMMWITAITLDDDGQPVQDPINYGTDYRRRWINNTDQDLAGYGNLRYQETISGVPTEFTVGGMYRHKNRTSVFDEHILRTMPIFQEWSGNIQDGTWNLFNTLGTPTHPLNYDCVENVAAVYGMVKLEFDRLEVLGGARFEDTQFSWESNAPDIVEGRVGNISYQDVLPSIHLKFMPNDEQNIRVSYFSSLSRPSFFEVIPYEINEEDFRERGNPFLSRTFADNFDARYERFGSFLDKVMFGVFYKRIDNPIESALAISGQSVFLQPNNFGTATNMGLEFDFTKYVRNFGIRMFYTYTSSEITTTKIVRFRDEEGNLTSRETEQTRPLQGQSAHISNVSLLYRNSGSGTDVQLAGVYTGTRIISVSPYLDNDIWQRGFVQLDLSVEQRIAKNFVAYVKVNNLLNTPLRADILLPNTFNPEQAPYIDSSENVLVREDFYQQTYLIGIRYKFVQY